jgi:hypothetical protein
VFAATQGLAQRRPGLGAVFVQLRLEPGEHRPVRCRQVGEHGVVVGGQRVPGLGVGQQQAHGPVGPAAAGAALAELADVMDRLRGDALEALAGLLAARVQQGDNSAFEEYKRVNERIKALKSAPPV